MKRFVMFLTACFLLMPLFAAHADIVIEPRERKPRPLQTKPDVPANTVVSPPERVPDESSAPANTVTPQSESIPDEPAALPNPGTAKDRGGNKKRN